MVSGGRAHLRNRCGAYWAGAVSLSADLLREASWECAACSPGSVADPGALAQVDLSWLPAPFPARPPPPRRRAVDLGRRRRGVAGRPGLVVPVPFRRAGDARAVGAAARRARNRGRCLAERRRGPAQREHVRPHRVAVEELGPRTSSCPLRGADPLLAPATHDRAGRACRFARRACAGIAPRSRGGCRTSPAGRRRSGPGSPVTLARRGCRPELVDRRSGAAVTRRAAASSSWGDRARGEAARRGDDAGRRRVADARPSADG